MPIKKALPKSAVIILSEMKELKNQEIADILGVSLDAVKIRLHRARIIELLPLNRVKLLTARNFTWRKDGPIQQFFASQVQAEFLDSTFSGSGEELRFVGGLLSSTGLAQMHRAIDRIVREFDELSHRDATLPLSERHSCSAVFAIRPWEFSMFKNLRRKPAGAR